MFSTRDGRTHKLMSIAVIRNEHAFSMFNNPNNQETICGSRESHRVIVVINSLWCVGRHTSTIEPHVPIHYIKHAITSLTR